MAITRINIKYRRPAKDIRALLRRVITSVVSADTRVYALDKKFVGDKHLFLKEGEEYFLDAQRYLSEALDKYRKWFI